MHRVLAAAMLLAFLSCPLPAGAYADWEDDVPTWEPVSEEPVYTADHVTTHHADGSDLDGMLVTFTYGDGATETLEWMESESGDNGWVGDALGVIVSLDGDAKFEQWLVELWKTSLSSILMDAGSIACAFDTTPHDMFDENSPYSSAGVSPALFGVPDGATISAYGSIGLDGLFYGDLYRYLVIDFAEPLVGDPYAGFSFVVDVDQLQGLQAMDPGPAPIPEPTTLLLAVLGLGGLVVRGVRRRG